MSDNLETKSEKKEFNSSAYPVDTVYFERRSGFDRRDGATPPPEILDRRIKPERRRRIDPTTFDKHYTPDEIEFGMEMSRFITRTGVRWPNAAQTLDVLYRLGYRKMIPHAAETHEPHLVG